MKYMFCGFEMLMPLELFANLVELVLANSSFSYTCFGYYEKYYEMIFKVPDEIDHYEYLDGIGFFYIFGLAIKTLINLSLALYNFFRIKFEYEASNKKVK